MLKTVLKSEMRMHLQIILLFLTCGVLISEAGLSPFVQNTLNWIKQQIDKEKNNLYLQDALQQNQQQKSLVVDQNNNELSNFVVNLNSSISQGQTQIKNLEEQYAQLEQLGIVDFSGCLVGLQNNFTALYTKYNQEGLDCQQNGTESTLGQIDEATNTLNSTYVKLDTLQEELDNCSPDSSGLSCMEEVLNEVRFLEQQIPDNIRFNNIVVNTAGASRDVPNCLETSLHNSKLDVAQLVAEVTNCFGQ